MPGPSDLLPAAVSATLPSVQAIVPTALPAALRAAVPAAVAVAALCLGGGHADAMPHRGLDVGAPAPSPPQALVRSHGPVAPHRGQSLAATVRTIEADYVHRVYGLTGDGVSVAVLDTGIDNDHRDFEGKIVGQHCFASTARTCAPQGTVESDNAQAGHARGTSISGIVLSKGVVSAPGVAPGADLVAVRIAAPGSPGTDGDMVDGLNWVMARQRTLGIRVALVGYGGWQVSGVTCDNETREIQSAIRRLNQRGVSVFAPSGDNGWTNKLLSPGCISNAVSVGATYDANYPTGDRLCPGQTDVTPLDIACFTNRARTLDLLAPGLKIAASQLGGGVTAPLGNTSYSAAVAAGVAALMLEADPELRPQDVLRIMKDTGVPVTDPKTGDVHKLVNARNAIGAIVPEPPTATVTATATNAPSQTAPTTGTATTPSTHTTGTPTPTDAGTPTPSPAPGARYMPMLLRLR